MSRVRILDEAADELEAAVAWAERECPGRGARLLEAYAAKLQQIERFPTSAPRVRDSPRDRVVRAFALRRFRYSIVVGAIGEDLVVVAIAHQSRAPGYWRTRLS